MITITTLTTDILDAAGNPADGTVTIRPNASWRYDDGAGGVDQVSPLAVNITITNGKVTNPAPLALAPTVNGGVSITDAAYIVTYILAGVPTFTETWRIDANGPASIEWGAIQVLDTSFTTPALPTPGPKGDKGDQGIQGIQGPAGDISANKGIVGNINNPMLEIPFKRAADATRLTGSQTQTRATVGTYRNVLTSLSETAAIDTPRLVKMSNGDVGTLIEESSQNENGNAFNMSTGWSVNGSTTATHTAADSKGGNLASSLVKNVGANAAMMAQKTFGYSMSTAKIAVSFLAKSVGAGAKFTAVIADSVNTRRWISLIDINAKTSSAAPAGLSIAFGGKLINGYQYVAITVDPVAAGFVAGSIALQLYHISFGISAGNGVDGNSFCEIQLEEKDYATSYINVPTAIPVARAADLASIQAAGNLKEVSRDGEEFSFVLDAQLIGTSNASGEYHLLSSDVNNGIFLKLNASGFLTFFYGDSTRVIADAVSHATKGIVQRFGVVVSATSVSLYVDGIKTATAARVSGTINTTSSLHFGRRFVAGLPQSSMIIGNVKGFGRALTDSEMGAV